MKKLFLVFVLFLTACAAPAQRVALPTQSAPIPARMLFPLYVYPGANGAAWQPVVNANAYQNIDAIVNPANGPGLNKSVNYTNGINKLRAANVGLYGYVYTSYGDRPIAAAKADVDRWLSWYAPLKGIFLDEAEYRDYQNDQAYYAELLFYINGKGLRVINNPGTGTTETYAGLADTTCIFESEVTRSFTFPSWGWNYPASKFCYLSHSANVEQMRAAVAMAKTNNIEYVYITNVSSGDYWASIPPYLAEEAQLLSGGIIPLPPSTSTVTLTPTKTATPTVTMIPSLTPLAPPTVTKTPTATPTALCVPALDVWVCDKKP